MATKETPANGSHSSSWLQAYRPILNRAIFALALVGLVVSAHITIQQSHGFDGGCTGFASAAQSGFDCAAVTQSDAATLFGVSNSVWGMIFYAGIALLTATVAFDWFGQRSGAKSLRTALILGGFLYSMYLVYYQFVVLTELCILCLISAAIVTLLLITQILDIVRPTRTSSEKPAMMVKSRREFAYMGTLLALVVVLIGADAIYFGSPEPPEPYMPPSEPSSQSVADRRSVADLNSTLPAECRYDADRGPVEDYISLVNFYDPAKGNPSAPVTVIEYFDPNCPHCRTLHAVMEEVIETHADQAHFVFKPFFLWQHSIAQSEALYAAAQEGKFFEMLEHQYALQNPQTGLSADELRQIAEDIGMDPDGLMSGVERGIYRGTLVQEKQKAVAIGVNSTPTVLINGRFVHLQSRSADCLRIMIEQASEG